MPRLRGVVFTFEDTLLARGETDDEGRSDTPERPVPDPDAGCTLTTCFGRYRLGLVSTSRDASATDIRSVLAEMDWTGWFESVATPMDLGYAPDDPNIFRAISSSMGIQPGMVAAVGTERAGSLAADSAGCWSVLIGTDPIGEDPSSLHRPVNRASSLAEVPDVLAGIEAST